MRLNTRMRYGTRAMVELALAHQEGPTSLAEIASRQGLSSKYLDQLFSALQAAGLVTAMRGARGGFVLARSPAQITLWDLYQVFEGGSGFVPCMDDARACERSDFCVTRDVWVKVYVAAREILDATTLEELAQQDKEKRGTPSMYYI